MKQGSKNKQLGQTLVEAALILPIICVLLLGIMEFGRILMIQHSMTNAAREGARIGALLLDDTTALSKANSIVNEYLTKTGVDTAHANVSSLFTSVSGNPAIEVRINYDFTSGLTAWLPGLNSGIELNSRVVMRREA